MKLFNFRCILPPLLSFGIRNTRSLHVFAEFTFSFNHAFNLNHVICASRIAFNLTFVTQDSHFAPIQVLMSFFVR